ncbi:MAG: hypothetical protein IT581_06590 [Verrucomicrobiales bacterium]|nr:hypothetical protein [Verrucomicrobiales bacterium]
MSGQLRFDPLPQSDIAAARDVEKCGAFGRYLFEGRGEQGFFARRVHGHGDPVIGSQAKAPQSRFDIIRII